MATFKAMRISDDDNLDIPDTQGYFVVPTEAQKKESERIMNSLDWLAKHEAAIANMYTNYRTGK
jgi:hypothetical protein